MLRMFLMQNWFNLSDEGMGDAVYDSYAMCSFLCIDFMEEQFPDATTLLKFRHLIEENKLGERIFADVNAHMDAADLIMHGGTVVNATLIAAPPSTKNQAGSRDPEMHQTKKGSQWHFGMKVHADVDAGSGCVHTITGTSANVHDIIEAPRLIRTADAVVYKDSSYQGVAKRPEICENEHISPIDFRINTRLRSIKMPADYSGINFQK